METALYPAIALFAAFSALGAQNPAPPTIPDGTDVKLRAKTAVNSANGTVGDKVEFEVDKEVRAGGVVAIPRGAVADAVVTEAQSAGRNNRPGKLQVHLTCLLLANGAKVPIDNLMDRERRSDLHRRSGC
jgi:hypothetical protein